MHTFYLTNTFFIYQPRRPAASSTFVRQHNDVRYRSCPLGRAAGLPLTCSMGA